MSSGAEAWRVWRELGRIEEKLSWGGASKRGRDRFDSLGRLVRAAPQGEAESAPRVVSRIHRVHYALQHAGPRAQKRVAEMLTGFDLSGAWPSLKAVCEEVVLLRGAVVAPNVNVRSLAAPPSDGAQTREWLIALIGLAPSADNTGAVLPGALRHYERGFRQAWGPTRKDRALPLDVNGSHGNVIEAALDFSKGHVIMVGVLLTLMAGHIAHRGSDRTAMLAEIRHSERLGPAMADWVAENEAALIRLMRPQSK